MEGGISQYEGTGCPDGGVHMNRRTELAYEAYI